MKRFNCFGPWTVTVGQLWLLLFGCAWQNIISKSSIWIGTILNSYSLFTSHFQLNWTEPYISGACGLTEAPTCCHQLGNKLTRPINIVKKVEASISISISIRFGKCICIYSYKWLSYSLCPDLLSDLQIKTYFTRPTGRGVHPNGLWTAIIIYRYAEWFFWVERE